MKFSRKLYYNISPKMRFVVRKIRFLPIDVWETITGKRHKYEPLKGDIYTGSGDFIAQGIDQVKLLKKHIQLEPDDAVLDVGSGIGRTAIALTDYLSSKGTYEGFDVVEKGVKWCNKKIKKDFPNFNFMYVPLNNDLYNTSKGKSQSFKFPYEDASFNKVFLFSVFTHMSVEEIGHYLCEIKRILKPGGLCLSTFFMYTSTSEEMIANGNEFSFPVKKDGFRLMSDAVKSANIALNDDLLDELITKAKLEKINMIEGFWRRDISKQPDNNYQDIVILKS